MKITDDTKQKIQSIALFGLEFYKVLMGTFLVLFIPQTCDDHSCSLNEVLNFDSLFHTLLLICNIVSFCVITAFYIIEMRREHWCIEYLDVDSSKPNNNLDSEIEHYPNIKENMNKLNKHYYNATIASLVSVIINYTLSTLYILPRHYGTNTFTSLISFCLLVLLKLANAYNVSYESIHKEIAYSGYMKTSVTFNVIDENHIINDIEILEQDISESDEEQNNHKNNNDNDETVITTDDIEVDVNKND